MMMIHEFGGLRSAWFDGLRLPRIHEDYYEKRSRLFTPLTKNDIDATSCLIQHLLYYTMNTRMSMKKNFFVTSILAIGMLMAFMSSSEAFAPAAQMSRTVPMTSSAQNMLPVASLSDASSLDSLTAPLESALSSSSIDMSAATLDPTTILSDVLGLFIGTPIILLVPIVAALGVAGLLAWGIVSYANPEVEDDEM